VRADEADVDHAIGTVDPYDDPILVARDVEHHPTVLEDARGANVSFDRGRGRSSSDTFSNCPPKL